MTSQQDVASPRSLAMTLLSRARKVIPKYGTKAVSSSDEAAFMYSYIMGLSILFQGRPCGPKVVGDAMRTLTRILKANDILGWIETCSDLRFELVRTGNLSGALLKAQKSQWLGSVVSLIQSAIPTGLIVHPSPFFNAVATFLGWLKRLPVCIRPAEEAVAEYYENDRRLSSVVFDENVYIPYLREIWNEWLGNFKLHSPFLPKHGSGSTADCGRIRSQKWDGLSWDTSARVCLRTSNLVPALDIPTAHPSRMAKVVFVPKQAGKDRAICMEPAWLQYLQQGVAGQLLDHIHDRRNPIHNMVDIYSQEKNRSLCARAHQLGLATIDLSDASDSVSWRLIGRLCRGLPIYRYLHGSRSTSTLIDGKISIFDKFAPMGSALCFPIECIVFASIVELAYRIQYDQASAGFQSGISIYGDDIICPAEVYHLVVDILNTLGFKVNDRKSFNSGPYRESCGVEYCYGAEVLSLKHPRSPLIPYKGMSPERIGMVSDLANSLLGHEYYAARIFLLKSYGEFSVRVGKRVLAFMDVMRFDDEHTMPIVAPYERRVWSDELQALGVHRTSIEASVSRAKNDYLDYQSRNVPLTRAQRISRQYPHRVRVHEKWSRDAIIALSRFGFWDLLETGDLETGGVCRTGRQRYRIRRKLDTTPTVI